MEHVAGDSNEALIAAALAGETRAFEQLVHRHYGVVYAIAFARLQSREQAEEVAQDAFIRAFLFLPRLTQPALFAHWLTRTTRNLSIDFQRKGSRAHRLYPVVPLDDVSADQPDVRVSDARDTAIWQEQVAELQRALQQLECEDRELLLLHYAEGLSHAEIAQLMELNRSTVTKRLGRLVLALRSQLRGNELESCRELRSRRSAKTRTAAAVFALLAMSEEQRTALAAEVEAAPAAEQPNPIPRARNFMHSAHLGAQSLLLGVRGFALWLFWYIKVVTGVIGALVVLCAGAYLLYSNVQAEVANSQSPIVPPTTTITAALQPAQAASQQSVSRSTQLQQQFAVIAKELGGIVGLSALHLETGETAAINADTSMPLFSVFKLPVAVVVLKAVEAGELKLEQKVRVTKSDLSPAATTRSAERWQKLPRTYTVGELLQFSLQDSDNTACDKLLGLTGGPASVTARLAEMGFDGIIIKIPTRDIGKYKVHPNQASSSELIRLLCELQKGSVLKPQQRTVLFDLLEHSRTGANRIRGLLPPGTQVLDKTGTGENASAINDVGLITLPDKTHLALAILISGSKLPQEQQEQKLAQAARAAYDAFATPR